MCFFCIQCVKQCSSEASNIKMEDDYSSSKRKTGGSDSSGDYETLIRPMMDRLTALSVSNVTSDARRVLEQFLKLGINQTSTSSNDWKSFVEQEPQYAEVSGVYEDLQPTPYQPMGSEQSLFEKSQSPKSRGRAVLFEKPGISLLEHSQNRYNFQQMLRSMSLTTSNWLQIRKFLPLEWISRNIITGLERRCCLLYPQWK